MGVTLLAQVVHITLHAWVRTWVAYPIVTDVPYGETRGRTLRHVALRLVQKRINIT